MSELLNPLQEGAARHASHLAILSARGGISYAEYYQLANAVAERLQNLGLKERDVLAISLPVNEYYPVVMLGCFQLGVVACPLNTRWPVVRQVETMRNAGVAACVTNNVELIAAADSFRTILLNDLIAGSLGETPLFVGFDPHQPATLLFTSGSMGVVKAALHTYNNHYYSARVSNRNIELNPGDRWLLSLPLFHVSGIGIVFRCLLGAATVAIPEPEEPIDDAIERLACTHLSLVPTQLYRLLRNPRSRQVLANLKAVLLGGAPIPGDLVRRAIDAHIPLYTTYGLTEMSSQVTTTRKSDGIGALFTAGRPHVVDSLAISGESEILVRGESLFRGYLDGEEIKLPLTRDGWFATGDLGRLDADGNLHVIGRRDNMFVCAGENVHPEEIERELVEIECVDFAVVVPVPDAEYGARPVAFVRTVNGAAPDETQIRDALSARLPAIQVPATILGWPGDATFAGLKPDRVALRNIAESVLRDRPNDKA